MRFLFTTIIVISVLCGVEVDIFTPSLPEIRQHFGLSNFMVQLLLSINFVAYCIFGLFAGALGDRFNRRRIILIGLWIFALGSVFCVFSSSFFLLLSGRFLQGMGIAGPYALLFAEIIEVFPREKQAGYLAIINGITTISMAFAPVVGSYVTLIFEWHANFVILLVLSFISLIMGHLTLPHRKGDPTISISPKAYLPLLKSPQLLTFMIAISFLVVPYWVFIAMSPILYMENLGVSLNHFGYYQGMMAGVFAIISFISPKIFEVLGQHRCLLYGIVLCLTAALLILLMTIFNLRNPMLITLIMTLLSAAVLFPILILFPLVMEIIPNAKGRITAFILASRLMLTAIVLQTISYFFQGTIVPVGIGMFSCLVIFFAASLLLYQKKWIVLKG